ncbi:hypothetical protein OXT66_03320 [Lentilactobacillus senioris]|nr:hypothetical protein [Lentilactobacillus senioris]MCY9806580.1 hypothetical protein [Lentilactobacillus senioris]
MDDVKINAEDLIKQMTSDYAQNIASKDLQIAQLKTTIKVLKKEEEK